MFFWYKIFVPQEYIKELTKQRAHNIYACGIYCFLFGTKQIRISGGGGGVFLEEVSRSRTDGGHWWVRGGTFEFHKCR
jgi:hypothetical protein